MAAFFLAEEVRGEKRLRMARFNGCFQLDQGVKDFSEIIGQYSIFPEELLVIGDDYERDIRGALKIGAKYIHCPVYKIGQGKEWNFGMIDLDM